MIHMPRMNVVEFAVGAAAGSAFACLLLAQPLLTIVSMGILAGTVLGACAILVDLSTADVGAEKHADVDELARRALGKGVAKSMIAGDDIKQFSFIAKGQDGRAYPLPLPLAHQVGVVLDGAPAARCPECGSRKVYRSFSESGPDVFGMFCDNCGART